MVTEQRLHRTAAGAREERLAILPVGAFEQHGPHLPLTTDSLIAAALADGLAGRVGGLLLPALPVSCSQEHAGFPGSVWITAATLARTITDMRGALDRQGIEHLAIVNAHGGNYVLAHVAQEANLDGPRVYLGPGRAMMGQCFAAAGIGTDPHDDMHAGEYETSVMLACHSELVGEARPDETAERPLLVAKGLAAYTVSGVVGRPSRATAAKGRLVLDALADAMAAEVRELFPDAVRGGVRPTG